MDDAEGFVDFLDRQHMAEQRGHIDRAVCNHPHGIPERLEPWLALSAEGRVGGQPPSEELIEREYVVADRLREQEIAEINAQLAPSAGTCMVMGTASTMACVVEAMGMSLPLAGTAPSVSAERLRISTATGRQAVELARSGRKPSQIMTEAAFRNAIVVLAAIAGSTNAIIHLTAIARRLGLGIDLDDFHEIAQQIPVLVNCKPAGSGYLPDMHRDGGVPALLKTLESALDLDVLTVTGQTLRHQLAAAEGPQEWQDTIHRIDDPLKPPGALVTLRGSMAPQGS
jgi:dihydroxy-acid dehydratase